MAATLYISWVPLLLTQACGLKVGASLGFSGVEGLSRDAGIPSNTVPYIELAYLSAASGGNFIKNMSALGWTPGVVVQDTSNGFDMAGVYKKGCNGNGFCDVCAIAFMGTNDAHDQYQVFNSTKTNFCGVGGISGGFVDELRGFFGAPTWQDAAASLSNGACGQVYSIGHSLGGAVANLFAFCVNTDTEGVTQDKPHVVGIPKVHLVTFGALAVSDAPLWNGSPGNCFEGARLFIGDAQKDPPAQFQLNVLDFSAKVYKLMGRGAESDHIQNFVIPQLEQLMHANQWEVLWEQLRVAQLQVFAPLGGALVAGAVGAPGFEPITAMAADFIKQNTQELFFEYDVVPALLQPLQHPLAQTVKLSHPLSRSGAPTGVWSTSAGDFTVSGRDEKSQPGPACTPEASRWPSKPLGQAGFAAAATIAQGTPLPNHEICCYIKSMGGPRAEDCGSLLPPWAQCNEPMWR